MRLFNDSVGFRGHEDGLRPTRCSCQSKRMEYKADWPSNVGPRPIPARSRWALTLFSERFLSVTETSHVDLPWKRERLNPTQSQSFLPLSKNDWRNSQTLWAVRKEFRNSVGWLAPANSGIRTVGWDSPLPAAACDSTRSGAGSADRHRRAGNRPSPINDDRHR